MKKISLLAILSAVITHCYAQGFYVRLGLGYAFPQAGQTMYDTPIPYNGFPTGINGTRSNTATPYIYSYNIKGASYSAGLQTALGLGYMFSKNAGVQLDGWVGVSSRSYTFTDQNITLNLSGGGTILSNIATTQRARTPFILSPSLVLQSGGEKMSVYSRFGVALPMGTKVTQDQVISNAPGTGALEVDDYSWEIKSGFSLGFTAAAGLKYNLNDRVSLWAEASLLSLSVYTKEQDLKGITINGNAYSTSLYGYSTTVKYSKTATTDTNFSQFPTYAQPFSNIAFNVGVVFNLSDHRSRGRKHDDEEYDRTKPFRRR